MNHEELLVEIVSKTISVAFCLLLIWGFMKITMWLMPDWKWMNIGFTSLLCIDMALIVSGIAPKGFCQWIKK